MQVAFRSVCFLTNPARLKKIFLCPNDEKFVLGTYLSFSELNSIESVESIEFVENYYY